MGHGKWLFTYVATCTAVEHKKGVAMISRSTSEMREKTQREDLIHAAFYRGEELTVGNAEYAKALDALTGELLREDAQHGDLTVEALEIGTVEAAFEIRVKQAGVAAGLSEVKWLLDRAALKVPTIAQDGKWVSAGDVLLRVEGRAAALFKLERVVVNLIQRMSGIATATRELVDQIRMDTNVHVIATRKTPWGLLDKKAVDLGGGGTHRLSLSDAILIKTNHLRLAQEARGMSLDEAIRCAWSNRKNAAFVEVEVTTGEEAIIAARTFRDLQALDSCPCVLMLDNFSAQETEAAMANLKDSDLHDAILVESSGNVGKESIMDYAAAGVDAISVGALTHSARALDVSAKLICGHGDFNE